MVMLLYGKKKRYQIFTRNCPTTDFRATFLYNLSLLEKSRDENKVAAAEQGNFYWERRPGLFWKLCKESIVNLLVSLVYQFIWPSFTLVFNKKWYFQIQPKALNEVDVQNRSSRPGVFRKKGVLRNSQENTCARVSFSIKLQVWGQQLY